MGGKVLTEAEGRERSFEGLKVLGRENKAQPQAVESPLQVWGHFRG